MIAYLLYDRLGQGLTHIDGSEALNLRLKAIWDPSWLWLESFAFESARKKEVRGQSRGRRGSRVCGGTICPCVVRMRAYVLESSRGGDSFLEGSRVGERRKI